MKKEVVTDLDRQIEYQIERVKNLDAERKKAYGVSLTVKAIELKSAKKVLNELRSQKIDELIIKHDRLDAQLIFMQQSRLEFCDERLLAKYDELTTVKNELAQVQLDQIEAAK